MKTVTKNGEKIKLFDSREELKWYYHAKLCRCEDAELSERLMNQVVDEKSYPTIKDVNEFLERMGEPCRVKEEEVKNGSD